MAVEPALAPITTLGPAERFAAWFERRQWFVPVAAAIAYLPFTFLGYGTDIDVANLRGAGESILEGDYRFSRPPGSLVYETAVGLLDRVGGSVAVNLGSLVMAVLALAILGRLLRRMGSPYAGLLTLIVAVNPFFVIAAASLGDFMWAIALVLAGIDRFQRGQAVVAAGCWALAVGCRGSTAVLVVAYLVGEAVGSGRRRRVALAAAMTAGAAALMFVPSWLSVGRSTDFLRNEFEWAGLDVHIGRAAVKNLVVLGVGGTAVVLVGFGHLLAALRAWSTEPLLRFAVIGAVASELLFIRFPWKVAHLLPVLVLGAVVYAASPRFTARFGAILLASQLLYAVVGLRVLVPDTPDRARSFRFDVAVVEGPLLNDVQCRLDDRRSDVDSVSRSERAWACTLSSWRGDAPLDSLEVGE